MSVAPEPIGVALCGASGIAIAHGHALQRSPHTRLLCVHSRDAQRAKRLGDALECAWTTSYEELLDDRRVAAVDIVTEPARHAELALSALARGKHVLIEKPIDVDLDAAARIVAAAAASPQRVSVVSPRRFDLALRDLRERMLAGEIGPVHLATAFMLLYRDRAYYEQPPGWRQQTGHVLLNQGIHWLDTFIWLFGFPDLVAAATAARREFSGSFDTAVVTSRHRQGTLSVLSASTACAGTRVERLTVHGGTGSLEYSAARRRGPFARLAAAGRRLLRPASGRYRDPLMAQGDGFAARIQTGGTPSVTAQDGYDALRFVKLCEAAAAEAVPTGSGAG